MSTENFYKELPVLKEFAQIADPNNYVPVPLDWYVVITDVVGSTKAIEAGKYKEVNIAGGIVSMAISNLYSDMDFPFIFGGDGITFLIPGSTANDIRDVLADSRNVVRDSFGLDLRCGMVKVEKILEDGHPLGLAKLYISHLYNQACISGSGLDYAEELVKGKGDNPYLIPLNYVPKKKADFGGFTCRWKDIKSRHGNTLAIIVKARSSENELGELKEILNRLEALLGDVQKYHPITKDGLKPADSSYLENEAKVYARGSLNDIFKKRLKRIKLEVFLTNLSIWLGISFAKVSAYGSHQIKDANVIASDFRKYDGTLKMIVSCSDKVKVEIHEELERLYIEGKIFYGTHRSDRALSTCLLHEGSEREVHFIDAADGGYALASKPLKAQIKAAKEERA